MNAKTENSEILLDITEQIHDCESELKSLEATIHEYEQVLVRKAELERTIRFLRDVERSIER